jgi:serine/threonine protein kinase
LGHSGEEIKDVDSDNRSLDHSDKIEIDLDWQEELQKVRKGDELGKGSFGIVYQGLYAGNSKSKKIDLPPQMAMKVVRKEDPSLLKKLEHECELLRSFSHENIIKYYGCVIENKEAKIFMELMPHTL